jgi:hypothetical protein
MCFNHSNCIIRYAQKQISSQMKATKFLWRLMSSPPAESRSSSPWFKSDWESSLACLFVCACVLINTCQVHVFLSFFLEDQLSQAVQQIRFKVFKVEMHEIIECIRLWCILFLAGVLITKWETPTKKKVCIIILCTMISCISTLNTLIMAPS